MPSRRRKESTKFDRAINVGISLPSFNFVGSRSTCQGREESPFTRMPRVSSRRDAEPPQPASVDLDEVLYATVLRRAEQFDDSSMNLEKKMARTWQALLRHSEKGRFGNRRAGPGNPICTALCLEATEQVLVACGASVLLRNVLVCGLANSIYTAYDPDQDFERQEQYADVVGRQNEQIAAQEAEIVRQTKARELADQHVFDQLSAANIGQILLQLALPRRVLAVTEILTPVLDDELFLVLWNATATTHSSANQLLEAATFESVKKPMSWTETRKRGAALASLVLQERVRLVVLVWQELSMEEKHLAYKALDPSNSAHQAAATLKSVLHALEETYVSELVHHQRQLLRRNVNLDSHLGMIHESDSEEASATGRYLASAPALPRASDIPPFKRGLSRPLLLTGDSMNSDQSMAESKAVKTPHVLLTALAISSSGDNHEHRNQIQVSSRSKPISSGILPEQLLASHTDVLRTCEDTFYLLCEIEQQQVALLERHDGASMVNSDEIEEGIIRQAREKLRDLLCTYVEPSKPIQERFNQCEEAREKLFELESRRSDDDKKVAELMYAIIDGQRRNPELLVHTVNRSPETLLSAMSLNPGMLLFSILQFPESVKEFLSLDSKACDYFDTLVQRNKGVQLLWKPLACGYSGHETFFTPAHKTKNLSGAAEEFTMALPSGDSLEQGGMLLLEWFISHLNDLADLLLEHPKPLQLLFTKMHQRGDGSAFYQMMLLLHQTPGVASFITRTSIANLERLALEDQSAVLTVLRAIFQIHERSENHGESAHSACANRELLDELLASPHLLMCLSSFDSNVLQDVFLGNVDVWGPFFVDMVASNESLLRQSLVQRVNNAEGGDTLVRLLNAVLDGTTAILDLRAINRALSAPDIEQEKQHYASARRKERQCIYLRGLSTVFQAVVAPQIAILGYNPRHFSLLPLDPVVAAGAALTEVAASGLPHGASKDIKGGRPLHRSGLPKRIDVSVLPTGKKRRGRDGDGCSAVSLYCGEKRNGERTLVGKGGEIPLTWQLYLRAHAVALSRNDSDADRETLPILTKARVKTMVLDIWLEFVKVDHLQLETTSLWSVAPFVCDYLVARYNAPIAVGARLQNLLSGLLAYQDDVRVAFFASACGLVDTTIPDAYGCSPPSYDIFLYYIHALAHLFYGQMKIFQSGNRLDETTSGSCPIDVQHAVTVSNELFSRSLTEKALRAVRDEIEGLPRILDLAVAKMTDNEEAEIAGGLENDDNIVNVIDEKDASTQSIELDDLMDVFLKQWNVKAQAIEDRYRQAFAANELGGDRIGIDEFIKIVTGVTAGRLSPRECRLVYNDAGFEFMSLDLFLRVTRVYQLRTFDTDLPEVNLNDSDLRDLRLSVGRANIASTQREVEDLARYWRSVRCDVKHQLEATHQKKTAKSLLKNQCEVIEKLVASTPLLLHQVQDQPQSTKRQATSSAHTAALQESLDRVWHEVRTCVTMLHRAKLTQQYLSELFLRSNMLRWIRQAHKRRLGDGYSSSGQSTLPSSSSSQVLLRSASVVSKTGSVQSISSQL